MKNAFLLGLTFALLGCQSGPKPVTTGPAAIDALPGFSIMQGVTGPTWTRINLVKSKNESVKTSFQNADGSDVTASKFVHEHPSSEFQVEEYELKNLSAATTYTMKVSDPTGKVLDQRTFQVLPDKATYKFAVTSCSDDFYKTEQKSMWSELADKNPEFILRIGDNVYADRKDGKALGDVDPATLWSRNVESRQTLQIYRTPKLIPTVAVWDDHDYGANDGDRRYKFKGESLQIFLAFFPQSKSEGGFVRGPGAASRWTVGGQAFLFMDNRSFRSPNQKSPICKSMPQNKLCESREDKRGPDEWAKKEPETHFGIEQERWAFNEVRKVKRPTWLISGDQWFGAYHPFESYQGNHPNSFRKFVKEMSKSAFRVAFISGDRHSSELTRIPKKVLGYESFEVVSSPIHAKVFPSNWGEFPNAEQAFGTAESMNYTILQTEIDQKVWKTKTTNFKPSNLEAFNAESLIWLNR